MFIIRTPFGTNWLYWNNTARKWTNSMYTEFATLEFAQNAALNIPATNVYEIVEN